MKNIKAKHSNKQKKIYNQQFNELLMKDKIKFFDYKFVRYRLEDIINNKIVASSFTLEKIGIMRNSVRSFNLSEPLFKHLLARLIKTNEYITQYADVDLEEMFFEWVNYKIAVSNSKKNGFGVNINKLLYHYGHYAKPRMGKLVKLLMDNDQMTQNLGVSNIVDDMPNRTFDIHLNGAWDVSYMNIRNAILKHEEKFYHLFKLVFYILNGNSSHILTEDDEYQCGLHTAEFVDSIIGYITKGVLIRYSFKDIIKTLVWLIRNNIRFENMVCSRTIKKICYSGDNNMAKLKFVMKKYNRYGAINNISVSERQLCDIHELEDMYIEKYMS